MADPDVNPERPPAPPASSILPVSGPVAVVPPVSAASAEDPHSQGLGMESTKGYTGPADVKADWHLDLRLEDLKLDPSKNSDSVGRLEHYEILGYIGRGAMGVVLKAFDEQLHRQVAIKVMSPDLVSRPSARERFFREARAAAGINHPNVVTIHAVSEHRGLPYLVMEFVAGMTLAERIHQQAPLASHDILRLCVQIAAGLSAAHRQGVIHRDVKPANIMLEAGLERVKITDFGLARVAVENSDLTSFGDMVGTPAFMSPEQVDGQSLDERSDLFSLGCVIYAMVAGKSPFRSGNALATARKVITDPHRSLNEVEPKTPKYLVEITDKLLQKRPEDRYGSADALHEVLLQRMADEHLAADDSTVLMRMARGLLPSPKTNGRRAWPIVVTLLVLVVVAFEGNRLWQNSRVLEKVTPDNPATVVTPKAKDPQVVTVAADGSADVRSLNDALRRILPGGTIRVLDAARYEIPVRIDSVDLFSNITLEATAGATLTTAAGVSTPVLTVHETPGVTIRGFTVETTGPQRALEVTGNCAGLMINNCVLRTTTPLETTIGSVYLHAAASGGQTSPIQLQNLRIECGAVGIIVGGGKDESTAVSHVVITECQIRGASRDYGIPVVLQTAVNSVLVTRNLFSTGTIGVNLAFSEEQKADGVVLSHNTFHNLPQFLGLPDSLDQNVRIENNLVVESRGPLINNIPLEETQLAKIQNWFQNNWSEHNPGDDGRSFRQIAKLVSYAPLRSREWGSPNFLVPSADAPLDMPGRFGAQQTTSESTTPKSDNKE